MVRIVHTGDMHFDSPFRALPASVAQLRKEEQRETFLRIVETVREKEADLLLLSGDVFDSRYVSPDTVSFLKEAFASIPKTAVLIAPGNHDFLAADSPYTQTDFGENVHIFGAQLESVEVGEAVVYGIGFGSRFQKESALPPFRMHKGDKIGILLMHGDVSSESEYNPIAPAALSESGVSYVALGHVHSFSGFCRAGDTVYAYPGIPEGRHFDEETGGFIYGEIDESGANLSFVPVAKRKNCTMEVSVTDISSTTALLQKIRKALVRENLYKIVLTGEMDSTMYIDTAFLEKELAVDCLYIKVKDKTTLRKEAGEESLLARRFKERLAGRDDETAKLATRLGLQALGRQKR